MQRKKARREAGTASKQSKMTVEEVMAIMDHDQDGKIPTSDLLAAVRAAGVPVTKVQIAKYVDLHEYHAVT